jgi:Tfp pilus assembly major pilin PilA
MSHAVADFLNIIVIILMLSKIKFKIYKIFFLLI